MNWMQLKTCVAEIMETSMVLTIGFGIFIYASSATFFANNKAAAAQSYNSYDFIFIIVYELISFAIIAYYLKRRKYNCSHFNLGFAMPMFLIALLLVIAREGTGMVLKQVLNMFGLLQALEVNEPSISLQTNMLSTGLMLVVNSIYEEVLLTGYLFKRFEKQHTAVIIAISFLVRASFHNYQGLGNLVMVFALALVFGIYYAKYSKLWPIIIAHGMGNFFYFLKLI